MKKSLLLCLLLVVFASVSFAQSLTIHISGHVYNSATQAPIANHQVYIVADSTVAPYFGYYNMVTTNAAGFYEANVTLTSWVNIVFHVSTADCNGVMHMATGTNLNTTAISLNFSICDGTASPCHAAFTFSAGPVNLFEYHFVNASTGTNSGTQFSSHWNFGDGTTSTVFSPNHLYAVAGTYTACLVIYNSATNCHDSICHTFTIGTSPPPCTATFTFVADSLNSHIVHFFGVASSAVTSWTWSFGDGTSGTGADPHHTYATSGHYFVCLHVAGVNCQSAFCDTVFVSGTTPPAVYEIWGHVFAGANTLLDHGKARLFKINNGTNAAQLIAVSSIDSSGMYHFNNLPAGTYFVKARPTPNSQYFGQFLPTYYPHNLYWNGATAIVVPPSSNPRDISLRPALTPFAGPGMIGGCITEGFKSSAGVPVGEVDILLKPLSGDPYSNVVSDANGLFDFSDLAYGSYQVYPEIAGLTTIPAVINLDPNNPSANNLSLIVTSSQVAASVNDPIGIINSINIYPNPAITELRLDLSLTKATEAQLSIYDLIGRIVFTTNVSLSIGVQSLNYNLSAYSNGSYVLQLRSANGSVISEKFSIVK
ncbi:MAG: PKD domain-containing protein [Bacteroidota bacterium]